MAFAISRASTKDKERRRVSTFASVTWVNLSHGGSFSATCRLANSMPSDVPTALGHSEENVKPFYKHLEDKLQQLQEEISRE